MQSVSKSYHSLSLIWRMHGDVAVMALMIGVGLSLGGAFMTFIAPGL